MQLGRYNSAVPDFMDRQNMIKTHIERIAGLNKYVL